MPLSRFYRAPLSVLMTALALLMGSTLAMAEAATSPTALADLLENEQARTELIEALRRQVADTTQPASEPERQGFAARLAEGTQTVAQGLVAELNTSIEAVTALLRGDLLTGDTESLTSLATNLAVVVALALAVFFVLRRLAQPLFARMSRWAQQQAASRLLRRGSAVVGAVMVDVAFILLAWVTGYLVALFALGERGAMSTAESLFLNAFLTVEVFKVLLRALFASRDDGLRLVPLSGEEAAYWNAWLARLSGFIGYGMLFLVPLVNDALSIELGRLAAVLIMVVAFLYALVIILQNRERVAAGVSARAREAQMAFTRVLLGMLARSWHWLAIAYFAALGLVTLLRPEDALPFMLRATTQTLAAIGAGVFLGVVLGEVIQRRLRLPDETRQKYPTLEARLNSYIPTALKVMRLVILVVVALLVLDAWQVFNLARWLGSDAGMATLATLVTVALILFVAAATWIALASWIESRLGELETGGGTARTKTLLAIFRSAAAVLLSVMTTMVVLAEVGINIGPLIAGAGVIGLAVGFGAQKLVQDIITGVFIQLENAINVGEFVTAGGVSGTVEKLTIRSLALRDLSGTYHIVPFSSVNMVSNFMRDYGYHLGDYGVAYREDIDEVIEHLRAAFEELKQDPDLRDKILGELETWGVTSFDDSSINIRVRIKAVAGSQWALGRAYNRLVKRHFDAAGIEIPFPHTTLYFGQDKDGSAPPAPISIQQVARNLPGKDNGKIEKSD